MIMTHAIRSRRSNAVGSRRVRLYSVCACELSVDRRARCSGAALLAGTEVLSPRARIKFWKHSSSAAFRAGVLADEGLSREWCDVQVCRERFISLNHS